MLLKEVYTPQAHLCAFGAFKSPAIQLADKSRPDLSSFETQLRTKTSTAQLNAKPSQTHFLHKHCFEHRLGKPEEYKNHKSERQRGKFLKSDQGRI
jgi:hypothetical protein